MSTIDPTSEQFKALMTQIPDNTPVFMINFLKYKSIVAETGKTGKETYELYSQKAHPFVYWAWVPKLYGWGIRKCISLAIQRTLPGIKSSL